MTLYQLYLLSKATGIPADYLWLMIQRARRGES